MRKPGLGESVFGVVCVEASSVPAGKMALGSLSCVAAGAVLVLAASALLDAGTGAVEVLAGALVLDVSTAAGVPVRLFVSAAAPATGGVSVRDWV